MSDISIPGDSNQFRSRQTIQDLMEAERIPLQRMEETISTYNEQRSVWREVNRILTDLRESARGLFSFENPFNNRVAESSAESILTATATREANEEERQLTVVQTAGADRFLSQNLPLDFEVPSGNYAFQVGEEEYSFRFRGGRLRTFAETLNERLGDNLQASIVRNTSSSQVILIESLATGEENSLLFQETALEFGREAGIIEQSNTVDQDIQINENNIRPWTQPLDESSYSISNSTLTLETQSELKIPLSSPAPLNRNLVLEFEARVNTIPEDEYSAPSPPPGPDTPDAGSVTFEGITIQNASSEIQMPEWDPPEPPERVDDLSMVFLQSGSQTRGIDQLQDSGTFQTVQVELQDIFQGGTLNSINLRNRNTYRTLDIRNIRIYDPETRGDQRPVNALSTAQDAIVEMNGIEIVRDSNEIDDIIPGVTLNLRRASEEPVDLSIEPDRETIKDSIITFVGYYNQAMTKINILTRDDEAIVNEIDYMSNEEMESAMEQLGLMQGDITLNQLRSQLQRITMNSYPTRAGQEVTMLAQIGISTNASGGNTGGDINASRLRGYLEISEDQLDEALQSNLFAIKDLFGYDTDGDVLIDNGIAHQLDAHLQPYVQSGGIIATRIQGLESRTERENDDIEDYNRHLDRYEQRLRREFGRMEGTIQELEESSSGLENLNRNNNQ
ncbi:MAG: flagellar filament capping protein FliD [Spirochaetia bacterium]